MKVDFDTACERESICRRLMLPSLVVIFDELTVLSAMLVSFPVSSITKQVESMYPEASFHITIQ